MLRLKILIICLLELNTESLVQNGGLLVQNGGLLVQNEEF